MKIEEIIKFINKLMCSKLYTKIPRHDDIKFINSSKKMVFRKLKLIKFRFRSIETFIIAEINDIKKYPIINA